MTCGPWRPIYLDRYSARISDLWALIDIFVKDESAVVTVTGDVESASESDTVVFTLIDRDGQFKGTSDPLSIAHHSASTMFNIHKQFWWPTGYGKQPLYTVGSKLICKVGIIRRPVRVP
jgi:beta-mannosidase